MGAVMVEIANPGGGFEALSVDHAEGAERVTLLPGKTWRGVSGGDPTPKPSAPHRSLGMKTPFEA